MNVLDAYSSSSSEEDHTPSPAATRESQAKSLKSERARIELPPPPDDLVRDEHGASRKRRRPEKPTLPAVLPVGPREDRFLVHVFFPISHSHLQSFVKILMGQARLRMVGSPLKASLNSLEHFHVSLSRPATIRSNMIHDLVCDLRKAVSQCDAGSFDLEQDVIALQNKNKHRLFLASPLSNAAASSLPIQLINKISEVFVKHGLPRFFEDPRPHMSFAWTETIEVQPLFKEPRRESQTGLQVDVKEVSCTIGKSRFNFALRIDQ